MKSGRIESGPSGLIFMSFSSSIFKFGYFCGMVWSCHSYNVFFIVCVWSKGCNKRFSHWYQYGFDMLLAYTYLAICFGMIFIVLLLGLGDKVITRSKDDRKVLLVLSHIGFLLESLINASKRYRDVYHMLLTSVSQNRVMASLGFSLVDARSSGSLFIVLVYYEYVLVICLWSYKELAFWSLWSTLASGLSYLIIDLIIWLIIIFGLVRLCLAAHVYGGDGLIWRIHNVWLLLVLKVCRAFGPLMYAVIFVRMFRSSRHTMIKRFSFLILFFVES